MVSLLDFEIKNMRTATTMFMFEYVSVSVPCFVHKVCIHITNGIMERVWDFELVHFYFLARRSKAFSHHMTYFWKKEKKILNCLVHVTLIRFFPSWSTYSSRSLQLKFHWRFRFEFRRFFSIHNRLILIFEEKHLFNYERKRPFDGAKTRERGRETYRITFIYIQMLKIMKIVVAIFHIYYYNYYRYKANQTGRMNEIVQTDGNLKRDTRLTIHAGFPCWWVDYCDCFF